MSFQRMMRGLFYGRPSPVTYNPYIPFNRWMKRLRKNWWKWIGGLVLIFFITGTMLRFAGVMSIYEEAGVEPVRGKKYAGGIFDWVWWLRGQPPGWESQASGWGISPKFGDQYLNGPLNVLFLPLEFIFVDALIYLPGFFFGAIKLDTPEKLFSLPAFALTIAIKGFTDFAILVASIIPFIVLGFLLTFFGPFVIMRLFQSGNILLRLLGALLVAVPIIAVVLILLWGPQGIIDFINELFGKAREAYEGGP